jgi:hypothetical protein
MDAEGQARTEAEEARRQRVQAWAMESEAAPLADPDAEDLEANELSPRLEAWDNVDEAATVVPPPRPVLPTEAPPPPPRPPPRGGS